MENYNGAPLHTKCHNTPKKNEKSADWYVRRSSWLSHQKNFLPQSAETLWPHAITHLLNGSSDAEPERYNDWRSIGYYCKW